MTSLVLRSPCPHGEFGKVCGTYVQRGSAARGICPGGSETVLDPTTVLFQWGHGEIEVTVLDVIQALQGDS